MWGGVGGWWGRKNQEKIKESFKKCHLEKNHIKGESCVKESQVRNESFIRDRYKNECVKESQAIIESCKRIRQK